MLERSVDFASQFSLNNLLVSFTGVRGMVLVRILKVPVQTSNFKISACPDVATQLLQILIPTTFISLLCRKEQFSHQLCPRNMSHMKVFNY